MSRRTIERFAKAVKPALPSEAQKKIDENARRLNASRLCDAAHDLLDPDPEVAHFAEKHFRDAVYLATGVRIRSVKHRFFLEGPK